MYYCCVCVFLQRMSEMTGVILCSDAGPAGPGQTTTEQAHSMHGQTPGWSFEWAQEGCGRKAAEGEGDGMRAAAAMGWQEGGG
jgi:hypothetical protein